MMDPGGSRSPTAQAAEGSSPHRTSSSLTPLPRARRAAPRLHSANPANTVRRLSPSLSPWGELLSEKNLPFSPLSWWRTAGDHRGLTVRGIYAYKSQGPDELDVAEGQLIQLTDGPSGGRNYAEGWWEGMWVHLPPSDPPVMVPPRARGARRRRRGRGARSTRPKYPQVRMQRLTYSLVPMYRCRLERKERHIPEQLRKRCVLNFRAARLVVLTLSFTLFHLAISSAPFPHLSLPIRRSKTPTRHPRVAAPGRCRVGEFRTSPLTPCP